MIGIALIETALARSFRIVAAEYAGRVAEDGTIPRLHISVISTDSVEIVSLLRLLMRIVRHSGP